MSKQTTSTTSNAQQQQQTPATGATSPLLFASRAAQTAKAEVRLCEHKDKKGQGCRLPARAGIAVCANHQPPEDRLSVAELRAIAAFLQAAGPEGATVAYVRALGFHAARALAKEQATLGVAN